MGKLPDFSYLSLVLIAMAFQLHLFSMGTSGKYSRDTGHDHEHKDRTIKSFLVLAFVAYIAGLIASLLMQFEDFSNKATTWFTIIVIYFGGMI